jgi:hypothetical protein
MPTWLRFHGNGAMQIRFGSHGEQCSLVTRYFYFASAGETEVAGMSVPAVSPSASGEMDREWWPSSMVFDGV